MSMRLEETLRRLMARADELRRIIAEEEQRLREKQARANQIYREYLDEIVRTPDPRMRFIILQRLQRSLALIRNEIYNEASMLRWYRQQLSIVEADIARARMEIERVRGRVGYPV